MTTYRKIHGRSIQAVTTDPSESVSEGQIWYNTNSDTFKSIVSLEAFTSSSSMGTGRYQSMWAGEGTQNATLSCSGRTGAPAIVTNTEEYNGSGWSVGGACNNAENSCGGFGTQTAAIKAGGYPGSDPQGLANESESYNGTSWTSGNNINTARQGHVGAGVSTAGVIFGGNDSISGNVTNKTEEYDGTNFSNGNNMNNAIENLSGVGIQTAALAAGGQNGPVKNFAESYDGTNWTSLSTLNTARRGSGGFGNLSNSVLAGGAPYTAATETWDGTSWSTSPATLATARAFFGDCGAGTSTAGIVAGGVTSPGIVGITEEYNKTANVFTAAAWGAGTNLPSARSAGGGTRVGTQSAFAIFGAYISDPTGTETEEYDGTTWSGGGAMGTGRYNTPGSGTLTAALAAGGNAPPSTAVVEEYDGSSWSEQNDLSTARFGAALIGPQTAAALCGGDAYPASPRASNKTEEYDGTNWTNGGNLNTGRATYGGGAGTQTAGLAFTGNDFTNQVANVEEYNGTAWTNATAYPLAVRQICGAGTQTAAWGAGGNGPSAPTAQAVTTSYDGTSWSTAPSLGTARYSQASGGPNTAGIVVAGSDPGLSNKTEEFTGVTETLNVKTLTQS